jgi:archaemetzincin
MRLAPFVLLVALCSCSRDPAPVPVIDRATALRTETLPPPYDRLRPLALPLPAAGVAGWLAVHPERGQSLEEFEQSPHRVPSDSAGTIVLTRLGNVSANDERTLALVAMELEAFFARPARFAPDLDLARIPASAQRTSRGYGLQVQSLHVLDSLLVPQRPHDAWVFVALSTLDLYPEPSWNFVFGQARPEHGVGVWSLARFAEPGTTRDERTFLLRTLRTASHEIGHLAGLPHCIAFSCLMNGSNSLPEADARPLELCPVCMAKLCRALSIRPDQRAARLADAFDRMGLAEEARQERKVQRALEANAD